jgi:hypothetical protein
MDLDTARRTPDSPKAGAASQRSLQPPEKYSRPAALEAQGPPGLGPFSP